MSTFAFSQHLQCRILSVSKGQTQREDVFTLLMSNGIKEVKAQKQQAVKTTTADDRFVMRGLRTERSIVYHSALWERRTTWWGMLKISFEAAVTTGRFTAARRWAHTDAVLILPGRDCWLHNSSWQTSCRSPEIKKKKKRNSHLIV